jgi:ubiquinone/menaquinone biosynthesis C-methylase UbiE
VGCGAGVWAVRIGAETGATEAHGVDVIDGCTSNIPFRVYDGKVLPYEDGYFDSVLVFCVLHHAEEPAALVSEIARVCRIGGKVLVVEDMASSRLQTFFTLVNDLYGNRVRNFWRALFGSQKWAMTGVPMTYEYKTYPEWWSLFRAHGLCMVDALSIPHQTMEHGVFVLEKRAEGQPTS